MKNLFGAWRHGAAMVGVLAAASGVATAGGSLVGDTVEYWTHAQLNGQQQLREFGIVTDPGHEFTVDFFGTVWYTLDIGPNSLRLDTYEDWFSPWFNSGFPQTHLEIRDLDWSGAPGTTIVDVIVTYSSTGITHEPGAPDDLPAFSAANVSFTADSVRIVVGGYAFAPGSWVNIEFVTVPGPGAAGVLGASGLLAARRRRRA